MSEESYTCYDTIEKSALKEMEEESKRDDDYKRDLLKTLKDIESSTTKLVELIEIIISSYDRKNNIC